MNANLQNNSVEIASNEVDSLAGVQVDAQNLRRDLTID